MTYTVSSGTLNSSIPYHLIKVLIDQYMGQSAGLSLSVSLTTLGACGLQRVKLSLFTCSFIKKAYGSNQFQDLPGISIICHLAGIRAILITKTKTRSKMIAIHILKLKLKYSKKLNYVKTTLIHG